MEAFEYVGRTGSDISAMRETLALPEAPAMPLGVDCKKPHECEFYAWCHRDDVAPDLGEPVEFIPSALKGLDDLPYPLHFVDFETIAPALPIFIGTQPYQSARVQWSIHSLHADGLLEHREWLVSEPAETPSFASGWSTASRVSSTRSPRRWAARECPTRTCTPGQAAVCGASTSGPTR